MTDKKICRGCPAVLVRRPHERNYRWAERKYCSRQCAARMVMRDPTVKQRQLEAIRAKFANDPEFRARHRAAAMINGKKGVANRNPKKQGEALTRNKIGWIPAEYMAHYRKMREYYGAAEAKRMIREDMAKKARQQIAANSNVQIEREQRRLREAY